ncbi:MAG: NERD domain-containing protein, partial [Muribaculaceae bacterium]|nr:NERD domain-containing protein [Muribaculaceae bacterium]
LKHLKGNGCIVLNDLLLPSGNGRTSQIDHIVVSRRGIFVIETKSLAGRIVGGEHSQYWTQHLSSQSRQIYNPLLQNRSHIRTLRRLLDDYDESLFVSMVVFTEAWRLDLRADDIVIPRRWLSDRRIARTFLPSARRPKRWWRRGAEVRLDETQVVVVLDEMVAEIERRKKFLDRETVREIARTIEEADMQGRKEGRTHTVYARETSRNISREIRQGICPRCGGRLIVKRGEKGEFVGCENYPECRFTCSIDRLNF